MAKGELSIDISAQLTVSDEMADRCLVLLEWWQKGNPNQRLMGETNADGSIHLYREQKNDTPTSD